MAFSLDIKTGAQRLTSKPLDFSAAANLQRSLEAKRTHLAPHIPMVITSDETPESYSISSFPTVVVVDKQGRVRFVSHEISFEDDDTVGELIRRLVQE
jgi:predicted transcriptional regulator